MRRYFVFLIVLLTACGGAETAVTTTSAFLSIWKYEGG